MPLLPFQLSPKAPSPQEWSCFVKCDTFFPFVGNGWIEHLNSLVQLMLFLVWNTVSVECFFLFFSFSRFIVPIFSFSLLPSKHRISWEREETYAVLSRRIIDVLPPDSTPALVIIRSLVTTSPILLLPRFFFFLGSTFTSVFPYVEFHGFLSHFARLLRKRKQKEARGKCSAAHANSSCIPNTCGPRQTPDRATSHQCGRFPFEEPV